jgi:hypothetical protein
MTITAIDPTLGVNCVPVYSQLRFSMDYTEGFPIFDQAFAQQRNRELTAFNAYIGNQATQAGFGNSVPLRVKQTNLEKQGEIPGGGNMLISQVAVLSPQFSLKPLDASSLDSVTRIGNQEPSTDVAYTGSGASQIKGGALSYGLRSIARCGQFFFRYGTTGKKFYLPDLAITTPHGAISETDFPEIAGAPYQLDPALKFFQDGMDTAIQFGWELTEQEAKNAAWDITGGCNATDPGVTLRRLAGYAPATSAPTGPGQVLQLIDLTVVFFGVRSSS